MAGVLHGCRGVGGLTGQRPRSDSTAQAAKTVNDITSTRPVRRQFDAITTAVPIHTTARLPVAHLCTAPVAQPAMMRTAATRWNPAATSE